jgi:hypothetical protein
MENPTPFDLNGAIRRWLENLNSSAAFSADNREELASHLRASVQRLQAEGHLEEEAFQIATQRIGEQGALEGEFAKVNPPVGSSFPKLFFWTATIMFLLTTVALLQRSVINYERITQGGKILWRPFSFLDFIFGARMGYEVMSLLFAFVLATLVCWKSDSGIWKYLDTVFTSRFANWAQTKPVNTLSILLILALIVFVMPVLSTFLAVKMSAYHIIGLPVFWDPRFRGTSFHFVWPMAMFYIAHFHLARNPSKNPLIQSPR